MFRLKKCLSYFTEYKNLLAFENRNKIREIQAADQLRTIEIEVRSS